MRKLPHILQYVSFHSFTVAVTFLLAHKVVIMSYVVMIAFSTTHYTPYGHTSFVTVLGTPLDDICKDCLTPLALLWGVSSLIRALKRSNTR